MTGDNTPIFSGLDSPGEPVAGVGTDGKTVPEAAPSAPLTAESAANDYEVVRFPDGSLHAIPKASIADVAPVTAVSEHVAQAQVPAVPELFYVWLANGQVRKVKEADLPPAAGTNAQFGLWVEGGKTYVIAGVYPVEHPR